MGSAENNGETNPPWQPAEQTLMFCNNGFNNTPETSSFADDSLKTVFVISQNAQADRNKLRGQDCMARAVHKEWACHVLCDGHGEDGYEIAEDVCRTLSSVILQKIHDRADASQDIEDSLVEESFAECENKIKWADDEKPRTGKYSFIDSPDSEHHGKFGLVKEYKEGAEMVTIQFKDGTPDQFEADFPLTNLKGTKYSGGCTCVCFIYHIPSKRAKIASMGDSRILVIPKSASDLPEHGDEDHFFFEPIETTDKKVVGAMTKTHTLKRHKERKRIEDSNIHKFDIKENNGSLFLVNPDTTHHVEPTRGMGNVIMLNAGFLNKPEVSVSFTIQPETVIIGASDGIFDNKIWKQQDFLQFVTQIRQDHGDNVEQMADTIYNETLEKAYQVYHYKLIDDMSMFFSVAGG
mmetsp:Transcript_12806/g.14922  ORF Transcript_12806/g.14922 Transcript_12806/m.14922 type:complete len:407 (+) Transcript_12806:281-1501(+)